MDEAQRCTLLLALNRAAACAQQAVEMARRLDDPGVLAFNLFSLIHVLWEPSWSEERLVYATEMLRCAKGAGAKEMVANHLHNILTKTHTGNRTEAAPSRRAMASSYF